MSEQRNAFRKARLRGVSRVSRSLQDGQSTRLAGEMLDALRQETEGFAVVREGTSNLSTTIIGMHRFRKDYRNERGPKPQEVAQSVPALWEPVAAKLGPLVFLGSDSRLRLVLLLESPDMLEQEERYAAEFKALGYELNAQFGKEESERPYVYTPHLTFGFPLQETQQNDPAAIERLQELNAAIEPYFGEVLIFRPAFTVHA